jgi:hypothetical protein
MTANRHKLKNRHLDTCPSCLVCGKGSLGPYTLQVVQSGGGEPVWTHATAMPKSMLRSRSKALKRQKSFCGNQSSTLVVPSNALNQRCASCVARRVVSLAKHCGQTCLDTTLIRKTHFPYQSHSARPRPTGIDRPGGPAPVAVA